MGSGCENGLRNSIGWKIAVAGAQGSCGKKWLMTSKSPSDGRKRGKKEKKNYVYGWWVGKKTLKKIFIIEEDSFKGEKMFGGKNFYDLQLYVYIIPSPPNRCHGYTTRI